MSILPADWLKGDYVTELLERVTSWLRHNRRLVVGGLPAITLLMMWYKRPARFPPGPRGVPGLGVVPFLDKMAARSFALWGRKYRGGLMSVRMGGNDLIILNNPHIVRKLFCNKMLMGRPAIQLLHQLSQGRGIFFVDDTPMLWEQRKFMGTCLRKLGMGKAEFDTIVDRECGMLNKKIESFQQKPFDILYLLTNAVSNNTCQLSLGCRFDYNNETFQQLIRKFCHAFYDKKAAAAILACLCYAPLSHLPGFSNHVADIKSDTKFCLDIIRSVIDGKKKNFDFDSGEEPKDFCEYFFIEQRKLEAETNSTFTDTQLLMNVKDMLFGGTITTTSTIRWCLYDVIKHPDYQATIQREIDENIGTDEEISYKRHKGQLPLTMSFIYESMRFHTTVPLAVPHSSPYDVTLDGYVIPKGTPVFSNVYACHNDVGHWGDPHQFRPSRHLDESGAFKTPTEYFLPFGLGSRRCLGESLAISEIFHFFVSIVRNFKLTSSLPPLDDATFGLLHIPPPFQMTAQLRH